MSIIFDRVIFCKFNKYYFLNTVWGTPVYVGCQQLNYLIWRQSQQVTPNQSISFHPSELSLCLTTLIEANKDQYIFSDTDIIKSPALSPREQHQLVYLEPKMLVEEPIVYELHSCLTVAKPPPSPSGSDKKRVRFLQ